MTPEQKLESLGLTLPAVPVPVANYVPYRWAGSLLYLSGQGPKREDGTYRAGVNAPQTRYSGLAPISGPAREAVGSRRRNPPPPPSRSKVDRSSRSNTNRAGRPTARLAP